MENHMDKAVENPSKLGPKPYTLNLQTLYPEPSVLCRVQGRWLTSLKKCENAETFILLGTAYIRHYVLLTACLEAVIAHIPWSWSEGLSKCYVVTGSDDNGCPRWG